MYIADGHCDALLQLWSDDEKTFAEGPTVSADSLQNGEVNAQVFAIFAPVYERRDDDFSIILRQVDAFHEKVKTNAQIEHKPAEELTDGTKTRAILALEGADAIGDDWMKWRLLKRLGVESVGLTWNEGNSLAAGCFEQNGNGLTNKGRAVVEWLKGEGMILDGAHLNEASFYESIERCGTFFVSHANVRGVHDHVRNLTDEQLKLIKKKEGLLGMTFFTSFINGTSEAGFADLARHIDYVAGLIGPEYIGLGSDFDGIPSPVTGLEGPQRLPALIDWLLQRYQEADVKRWAGENFKQFYNQHVQNNKDIMQRGRT
ncbi:dipeptidase [Natribacillus halophilus]|uniref:Dipeptidase. Metallo peptidase. MEROPS family M19 n=1 Tax=Natribacillus halophilus TaxID=549003 RepID=A0A1G8SIN3_9BACI|nr:membrane dipeptidase [Natribacillus halophilus]SDJ29108.1 dipeptidase. Metallo peptidase. MEROPS family M19 [Natribacillus halophilus]